jgi:hypothetical protein
MRSVHSSEWLEAMKDEMKSMSTNNVWDLEEIPKGAKTVGCKWVYMTKCDFKGNIERNKARLVAKGFTQREGIDYNETFSPVSCKDSETNRISESRNPTPCIIVIVPGSSAITYRTHFRRNITVILIIRSITGLIIT